MLLIEKEDLFETMKMFERLSRDHRIAISASIDAYRREEMLQAAESSGALSEKRELQEA